MTSQLGLRSHALLTLVVGCSVLMLCGLTHGHGGHHKKTDSHPKQGDPKHEPKHKKPHKFGDIDTKHIKHHLDDMGVETQGLKDKDLEFYHFKLHDVNSDSRIDGLEMFRVLKEEELELLDPDDEGLVIADSEVAEQVDSYLKEVDMNNDGYIDYTEYKANSHFFVS